MTLDFYVNVVLAVVGTGWALVWLCTGVAELLRERRNRQWRRENEMGEMASKHCRADAVKAELKALETHLGIRYEYNKDLHGYWFEPLPSQSTYKAPQ